MSRASHNHDRATAWLAVLVLAVTTVLALLWSHYRLMWQDEFLSFYTDSAPSAMDVVRIQLHTPISLDPPTYHLLSHAAMKLLGANAIALRLPALFGFLLMECALFALVRRLAGERAAVIAMALPLVTASFRYAVEGRPYGLLLGLYASSFACWYAATRSSTKRGVPLVGLALSIALAITSHYFGLLILVPVVTAEAMRTIERRKVDGAMLGALAAGFASIALILPFKAALAPYQLHYYINTVNFHDVSRGYRELFVAYSNWRIAMQRLTETLLVVGAVCVLVAGWRRFRTRPAEEPSALWAGLLAFAMLPFFAFLLGRFVTHTMEVRYVIATLIPFAIVVALLLAPRLERSAAFFYGVFAALLILALVVNGRQLRAARNEAAKTLAAMQTPAAVAAQPDAPLYIQSLAHFYVVSFYSPDPTVRARATLLFEPAFEVYLAGHNTNAVTAINMRRFTRLPITDLCSALNTPHPLLLDYDNDYWVWIGKALAMEGLGEKQLGPAYEGRLVTTARPSHCEARMEGSVSRQKK